MKKKIKHMLCLFGTLKLHKKLHFTLKVKILIGLNQTLIYYFKNYLYKKKFL